MRRPNDSDRSSARDHRLDGRTALVTGGGRNLGRAIALALGEGGAAVMIGVHGDIGAAEAVAAEIQAMGSKTAVSAGELSDGAYCRSLVIETQAVLGAVDIVVHAAAIRPHNFFLDVPPADWDAVMAINCTAAFHIAQSALPSMIERGFGRLIVLGGTAPGRAGLKHSHISVSKAGVEALVKELALEFGRYGITANVVSPGPMNTKRQSTTKPITQESIERLPVPRSESPRRSATPAAFSLRRPLRTSLVKPFAFNGGLEL